ncbi:MAG: SH3 domain-containing protein [Ktedonobacteraceae bacterium]|nr:SH3 domain-containing protein [Ktedonobacteraceae bacterium]
MGNQRQPATFPARYRVMKDYQKEFPDPLSVQAGELFLVSAKTDPWNGNPAWIWVWCTDQRDKGGWVPKNIIEMQADGQSAICSHPYNAVELTVAAGDELLAEQEESGWLWCVDQRGQRGWVPVEHVARLSEN